MSDQNFHVGDHVHVREYSTGEQQEAVIIEVSAKLLQRGVVDVQYGTFVKEKGRRYWFMDRELELIETSRIDLHKQWKEDFDENISKWL